MIEVARVFISVKIPITDGIQDILSELKCVRNVRVVNPEQTHITLKFLGDTDLKKIPGLCENLRRSLSEISEFDIVMKGMGAFPNLKNPRVVWLGFDRSDELMRLAEVVENTLVSMKLDFDEKKFFPHMTVGRINGKADVEEIIKNNASTEFCRFRCSSVEIMKSVLGPNGAKHTVIDSIQLLQDD